MFRYVGDKPVEPDEPGILTDAVVSLISKVGIGFQQNDEKSKETNRTIFEITQQKKK